MPTPVSVARQCLTEEAAVVLDDAVNVARRRSHAQTTSLHAVAALLALPSSMLRDACSRARSSAYYPPPRLQFRALELCVGVSLDRLPSSSKGSEDPPPVSNSLMAAIKRSQANQRRHPETFHLYQQMQQQNQSSFLCVKVELKHFVLSILDDPIVSRVLGDGGFRSCDIKLSISHPPAVPRFSGSRRAPLFLCNLTDSDLNRRNFSFPFGDFPWTENGGDSCRIGEILVKEKGKNPLLIGISAKEALSCFTECLQRGERGVLPADVDGLKVVCVEKEISEEIVANGGSGEKIGLKIKELSDMVENCSGPGIVVNFGDLKAFCVDDESMMGKMSYVVSGFTGLLEEHGGRVWLIGATDFETYKRFSAQFPSVEKDWDLHLLPITSSKSSKSSLMGSFVPLGGFFSAAPESKGVLSSTIQPITRSGLCSEKYEQEAPNILKEKPTSWNLPLDVTSSSCVTSVTTELRLGTIHTSAAENPKISGNFGPGEQHRCLSGSVSPEFRGITDNHSTTQSSSRCGTGLGGHIDPDNFKSIWGVLSDKVGWQDEAICTISQTVARCRAGNGKLRGSSHRGDIWLSFVGPDKVGKQKIALALAETIFGSKECLISVDLSSEDGINRSNSFSDHPGSSFTDRGTTVVDYISGEMRKKPRSVVLLENLENTDFLAQNSLSQAIKNGKFPDSYWREISISSMIFIVASTVKRDNQSMSSMTERFEYSEERILEAKGWEMRIEVERIPTTSDSPKNNFRNVLMPNKRKLIDTDDSTEQEKNSETQKRAHSASRSFLDLNLPVEEMEERTDCTNSDSESASDYSKAWLDEFFAQVDEEVIFKPFDFDALADKLSTNIRLNFQKIFGFEPLLEIDQEVMVQILAASWWSDRKQAVEEWVENVLCKSFSEAKQKHSPTGRHVVRLVACEGQIVGEKAPPAGVCLPARIHVS